MASKIHYDHCICCGSVAISKVLKCQDYTVSGEIFEIWKCANCTFRFTQDAPGADDIGKYYQSAEYVSHSDTKKGLVNSLYHYVRNFTLKTKRDLIKKVTRLQQGTLLDVGAGTGAFANAMQQAGWNVTGLEPDETARLKAFNNYSILLKESDIISELLPQTFDAITLWHVLEHVHDLKGTLEKFTQLTKPSGRLVIAVPNYTSYDAQVYQQYWAAYDVPRHLYHFSPKSIEILLKEENFILESIRPMWYDSFYVSMLSEKYKYGKDNFFQAVFTSLQSNLKAFFNRRKCSSLIYIFKPAVKIV